MTDHPINRWAREVCSDPEHAERYHHDCPETNETLCSYWVDIALCPDCGEHINPDCEPLTDEEWLRKHGREAAA